MVFDMSPLTIAIARKDLAAVKSMIRHGANVNVQDGYQETPLLCACKVNSAPLVAALLQAGADPNGITRKGMTPLYYAVMSCDMPVIQLLVSAGARPSFQPLADAVTPLEYARNSATPFYGRVAELLTSA
jgi:ankyrin repeat protein